MASEASSGKSVLEPRRTISSPFGPKFQQLKGELAVCKQMGQSVEQYFGRFTKIWDVILTIRPIRGCKCGKCECGLNDQLEKDHEEPEDKVQQFLLGLDDTYQSTRSTLLSRVPLPTIEEAYNVIRQEEEEDMLSKRTDDRGDTSAFAVRVQGKNREDKKKTVCKHCNRTGHTSKSRKSRTMAISPPADELAAVALSNDGSKVQKALFSDRVLILSILGRPDGGAGLAGQKVRIGGWVKTGREQGKGKFAFLEVNDGSCPANLQVKVDSSVSDLSKLVATGTCVYVDGFLKIPPEGTRQKIELSVEKVIAVGTVDPAKYPIPKTKLTLEFLRDVLHLRSRTNSISAVARIRNALAFATHSFFQEHSFLYVHTPIITTSDCEGAGEMFQVTTLINESEKLEKELIKNPPPTEADVESARLIVKEKGEAVAQLKAAPKASREAITASVSELTTAKENLAKVEERSKLKPGIPKKDGKIDYSLDFFGRQAFLTVSGQLQVESYACALGSVYTFGPTFRAENSHTSRHLAEFWMVEPEIAFADLEDDMNCAEAYVRYMCKWLLEKCYDDMEVMAKNFDKGCIDRLKLVASTPFGRVTYTEAIKLLEEAVAKGKKFENKVEWGIDLASEHERYLTEVMFQKPLIVYNYPREIKAFYMRLNDDGKTVAAMDVLVPKVGELIGGSQREERYDVIKQRIEEMELPMEPYEWYIDLRRYGTVKHSGFGLGFERMILFATGIDNIRDVIPFPRSPGKADL